MSKPASSGIGFFGLLAIVFITLKLLGKITWPWLWVLSPLWMTPTLFILFMTIFILIATCANGKLR